MYLGGDILITSKVQRSRSRQPDHAISPIPIKAIYPILVTDVFTFADMLISFRGQKVEGEGQSHRRQ